MYHSSPPLSSTSPLTLFPHASFISPSPLPHLHLLSHIMSSCLLHHHLTSDVPHTPCLYVSIVSSSPHTFSFTLHIYVSDSSLPPRLHFAPPPHAFMSQSLPTPLPPHPQLLSHIMSSCLLHHHLLLTSHFPLIPCLYVSFISSLYNSHPTSFSFQLFMSHSSLPPPSPLNPKFTPTLSLHNSFIYSSFYSPPASLPTHVFMPPSSPHLIPFLNSNFPLTPCLHVAFTSSTTY